MTKKEFIEELESMLELEVGTIKGAELLVNLSGWDSMAAIGFIAMADQVAGVEVVPAELAQCKTVADLATLVRAEG